MLMPSSASELERPFLRRSLQSPFTSFLQGQYVHLTCLVDSMEAASRDPESLADFHEFDLSQVRTAGSSKKAVINLPKVWETHFVLVS